MLAAEPFCLPGTSKLSWWPPWFPLDHPENRKAGRSVRDEYGWGLSFVAGDPKSLSHLSCLAHHLHPGKVVNPWAEEPCIGLGRGSRNTRQPTQRLCLRAPCLG